MLLVAFRPRADRYDVFRSGSKHVTIPQKEEAQGAAISGQRKAWPLVNKSLIAATRSECNCLIEQEDLVVWFLQLG